jgi:hypothetical protein
VIRGLPDGEITVRSHSPIILEKAVGELADNGK